MGRASGIAGLSRRELEIARAYAAGESYREIAERLFIAPSTVRTHLSTIYRRLGVSTKIGLLRALESEGVSDGKAGEVANASPPDPAGNVTGRRQVTVLSAALDRFSDIANRLDPEETAGLVATLHEIVEQEVEERHGSLLQVRTADQVACFGAPLADETDAERAVEAAVAISERIPQLTASPGLPLAARIGVFTGAVMLRVSTDRIDEVVGGAPFVAAALARRAEGGGIVVCDRTRAMTGNLFEYRDLGRVPVESGADEVHGFALAGTASVGSRFQALHGERLTPIVGRDQEIGLLATLFERACDGEGQVALVSGEAGIGKSRIAQALQEHLELDESGCFLFQCSPNEMGSALHPVKNWLHHRVGLDRLDTPGARADALVELFAPVLEDPLLDRALLAALASIPLSEAMVTDARSPAKRRAATLALLTRFVRRHADAGPVLLVFEDIHWADPTTLDWLSKVAAATAASRVLTVVTFRPELAFDGANLPNVTSLSLARLTRRHAERIIKHQTGASSLPAKLVDQIAIRSDGIPLFVEELTHSILEYGGTPEAVPITLQASLTARLDRLGPALEAAQAAAVIGRRFGLDLLRRLLPHSRCELSKAMERILASRLVVRGAAGDPEVYEFKHALVRDAAYDSLLRSRRQELHARIADVLERRLRERGDVEPEILARHCTAAGELARALHFWTMAGQRATERFANLEAVSHLRRALELVRELPDETRRAQAELDLQLALGGPLLATSGFASEETEAAYQRARELSRKLQHEADLFTALRGLGYVYHVRARLRGAAELSDEVVALAERIGDAALLAEAYHFAGTVTFHLGKFQAARHRFERSMEAGEHPGRYGVSTGVFCRAYISHCDWHLGYPDRALKIADEGLALARGISRPFSIALALAYLAMLHQFRREPEAALIAAEEARSICAEYRFDYYGAWSSLIRAWAIGESGRLDESLPAYDAALTEFRQTGAVLRMPHYLGQLAALHRKAGAYASGLRLIAEAAAIADANHESWCKAELHRERGEMLLLAAPEGAARQADTEFKAATEIAAAQGAKLLELRASAARAGLQAARGKRAAARDLLTPICGWFTEGSETQDLQKAKKLLEELH